MAFRARITDTGESNKDNITSNSQITLSGVDSGASVWVKVDDGTQTFLKDFKFSMLEGTHSYEFGVVGNACSSSTTMNGCLPSLSTQFCNLNQYLKVTVDTKAPEKMGLRLVNDTGISSTDGLTNNDQIVLAKVETGAKVEYKVDGGGWQTVMKNAAGGELLFHAQSGDHNYTMRQTDKAGNVGAESSIHVNLDTSGPQNIHLTASPDKSHLLASANEDLKSVLYKASGYGQQLFTESQLFKLTDKELMVSLVVADKAGNTSTTDLVNVTFDATHQHITALRDVFSTSHIVI